jgi:predicted dehydrogenase
MQDHVSRREFIKDAFLGAPALWPAVSPSFDRRRSANSRVAFAVVGVSGRGESDLRDAAQNGDVVAICDVDEASLLAASRKFPKARLFTDYRRLLDDAGKSIDAVMIATPDHTHAAISAAAMRLGKHCFCDKPLAHSIWETRQIARIARETRVVTQMGIQGTARSRFRRSVALIQAGALGTVTEVHAWTDRPNWPQGISRPHPAPMPASLHWNLWLGPAHSRPYAAGYHPYKWRGYWAFGGGALGDMGCHLINLAYRALRLHSPVAVTASCSSTSHETYPASSVVTFEFAASPHMPAVKFIWYDGGKKPSASLLQGVELLENGALIVGSKGTMYAPGLHNDHSVVYGGVDVKEPHFTESPGHLEEFVWAIKGGPPPAANFPDYAAALTETVLVGNLAVWSPGKRILWDSHAMRASNAEVNGIIRAPYRPGWSI